MGSGQIWRATERVGRCDHDVYYRGRRGADGTIAVRVQDKGGLAPCFHVCRHSPDGYAWGEDGGGAAQLALALLVHAVKGWAHIRVAVRFYHYFKREVIARIDASDWTIFRSDIRRWLEERSWSLGMLPPQQQS